MGKEIKKLSEAILNEFAIKNRDYKENKKAYDAAFAKGIEEWEHGRARKKGFTPATASELLKGCKKEEPELYPFTRDLVKGLNNVKIGKWTVLFGNYNYKNDTYHKNGKVNLCYVIAKGSESRLPIRCRRFAFKRYIKWGK